MSEAQFFSSIQHQRRRLAFVGENVYISKEGSQGLAAGYFVGTRNWSGEDELELCPNGSIASTDIAVVKLKTVGGQTLWVADSDAWLPRYNHRVEGEKVFPRNVYIREKGVGLRFTYKQLMQLVRADKGIESKPERSDESISVSVQPIEQFVADWQLLPLKDGRQPMHFDSTRQFITDGIDSIPVTRPAKREWKKYGHIKGLIKIPEYDWPRFLNNLVGSYLLEVIDDLTALTSMQYQRPCNLPDARSSRVKLILDQLCFDTYDNSKHEGRVRSLATIEVVGVVMYVVGAQNEGMGTYVFPQGRFSEAMKCATGKISAMEAINYTVNRKRINKGGQTYKQRLQKVIEDYITAYGSSIKLTH